MRSDCAWMATHQRLLMLCFLARPRHDSSRIRTRDRSSSDSSESLFWREPAPRFRAAYRCSRDAGFGGCVERLARSTRVPFSSASRRRASSSSSSAAPARTPRATRECFEIIYCVEMHPADPPSMHQPSSTEAHMFLVPDNLLFCGGCLAARGPFWRAPSGSLLSSPPESVPGSGCRATPPAGPPPRRG